MALQRYRGNVFSSSFPLISSFSGQSVIIPGIDQVQDGGDRHNEIPGPIFLENVMPMANGFQSIGFSTKVISGPTPAEDFDKVFYLRDAEERRTLYVPAQGKNYFYDAASFTWRSQPEPTPYGANVSVVNVKGRQFVFFAGHTTAFEWNGLSLLPIELKGLDTTMLMCLTTASAYLVAFSERKVFWSSILDPTDFVPSLESGAGGEELLSLKGNIVACAPVADGFLIYTTTNIISASYTGNIRFPWTFKEIAGGAGVDSEEKVTNDTSAINQYAYTVAGLMVLDRNQAVPIFPQVSEFIAGRRYETYDYSAGKIVEVDTNDALLTKINFISERYLVISYGDNELSYALVYDVSLKRWGKLAIPHVDSFEFMDQPLRVQLGVGIRYKDVKGSYQDQTGTYASLGHLNLGPILRYQDVNTTYQQQNATYEEMGGFPMRGIFTEPGQEPYKSIGFLQKDGTIKIVNFDLPPTTQVGVLFLGKYQLVRTRFVDLFEIWVEVADPTMSFAVIPSLNGHDFGKAILCKKDKKISSQKLQKFFAKATGMNFTLRFQGKFAISSLEAVFTQSSQR